MFFAISTKYVHAGFAEWIIEAISSMLLAIANIAVALTIFFLRYFITLASYNNYIDVSVVKLGWVMVRDVANMFFVVSLLIIAFATILGIEKYEWKKGLVKLVAMAVLINFSNLIAQIIIDAAHVFTITFLNAVSASAGGNLINMFSLEKISSIIQGKSIGDTLQSAASSIFAASVISCIFAVGAAVILGSYLLVMVIRVVILWALIILSPLAYLFSALPNGEKYASRWWEEFTKHVVVAPVMVFFLWLSFATLGTGQIMSEIQAGTTVPLQQSQDAISVSITAVSTWESMANYILALIFLYIGLKMAKDTGAYGSGMLQSAENFIQKTAKEASGYAVGRWLTGQTGDKGKSLTGKAVRGVFNRIPVVGGNAMQKYKYRIAAANERRLDRRDERAVKFDKDYRKMNELKMQARTGSDEDKQKAKDQLERDYGTFGKQAKAIGGRMLASLWQTSGRTGKEVEDYKDNYERTKKYRELKYSTSSLGGGIAKQEINGKLQIQEKISEGKKTQKGEDMLRRLAQDTSSLSNEEKLRGELPKLARDLEENAKKAEASKVSSEAVNAKIKQAFSGTTDGQKIATRIAEGKATIQNIQEEMSRSGRLLEARKRAEKYRDSGEIIKAEQVMRVAYQEIEEENAKKFKSMSRGERVSSGVRLMRAIGSSVDGSDEQVKMKKDLLSIWQYSTSKGADDMKVFRDALVDTIYTGTEQADLSVENQGKIFLEIMSGGKKIANSIDFNTAEEGLKKIFTEGGEEQRIAVLSNLSNNALWSSLEGGGVSPYSAIEDFNNTDPDSGREYQDYRIFNPYLNNPTERKRTAANNTFAGTSQYVDTKKISNLFDMAQSKRVAGSNGKRKSVITEFLPQQQEAFIESMTQFGDERGVSDGFRAVFSSATNLDNFDNLAKGQFIDILSKIAKDYEDRGLKDVGVKLMRTQFATFINDITTADGGAAGNVAYLKSLIR